MLASSLRTILTIIVLGAFCLQVSAFVLQSDASQESIADLLMLEAHANQLTCPEVVASIDVEIELIDQQIQNAAPEELPTLQQQRKSLVELRLSQPCHSDVPGTPEPVVDELFNQETSNDIVEESIAIQSGGYGDSLSSNGGLGGGTSGGAGGAVLGLAGLAGLAGLNDSGTSLAGLAGLDDDGPPLVSM